MTGGDPWAAVREPGMAHVMITAADDATVNEIVACLGERLTVQLPVVRPTSDGVVESQFYARIGRVGDADDGVTGGL